MSFLFFTLLSWGKVSSIRQPKPQELTCCFTCLKNSEDKIQVTTTDGKWVRNLRKKTAWQRKPQILITTYAKFLSDTWTPHGHDRLQAAQLRTKKLNWYFGCYPCLGDSLGFESVQVVCRKERERGKSILNTFLRENWTHVSKTCYSVSRTWSNVTRYLKKQEKN